MRYRDLEHRLLANSVVDDSSGCWVWLGNTDRKGYGRICVRRHGRPTGVRAHRLALVVLVGHDIDEVLTVDHLCRNPGCINPAHLEVVTRAENTRRRNEFYRSDWDSMRCDA